PRGSSGQIDDDDVVSFRGPPRLYADDYRDRARGGVLLRLRQRSGCGTLVRGSTSATALLRSGRRWRPFRRDARSMVRLAMKDDRESAEPLISVITIFLDAERYLAEAVESVFAQTLRRWELLLVD